MMILFNGPAPTIVVNDPEVVNELYVTKNKYVDKHEKFHNILKGFFGNSILFSPSTEQWAIRRKHLSAAFYKDKLSNMLAMIISITNQSV